MNPKNLSSSILLLLISILISIPVIAEENPLGATSPNMPLPEPVVIAKYTSQPIVLDGKLDEEAWKNAESYSLTLAEDRLGKGMTLEEGAKAQVTWDDQNLYIGVQYIDSEIIAEGTQDQLPHFTMGDVCEVFLKPKNQPWYFELFATPRGKLSHLWWPKVNSVGKYDGYNNQSDMKIASFCQGTLNQSEDRDQYWICEIAMPLKDLTAPGAKFGAGDDWSIMVSRYNYSKYLKQESPEYSMIPRLTKTNYHLVDEYATLLLIR